MEREPPVEREEKRASEQWGPAANRRHGRHHGGTGTRGGRGRDRVDGDLEKENGIWMKTATDATTTGNKWSPGESQ